MLIRKCNFERGVAIVVGSCHVSTMFDQQFGHFNTPLTSCSLKQSKMPSYFHMDNTTLIERFACCRDIPSYYRRKQCRIVAF